MPGTIRAFLLKNQMLLGFCFFNNRDFLDLVTLTDQVHCINAFNYFPKTSMISVKMRRISATMTNKEL
jgi:hypothetical protein